MRMPTEWLLAVCLAGVGAVCLARIPGDTLRGLPLSALTYLVALGCCVVASEAAWNARPWRFRAAAGAFVLTLVAHLADGAVVGTVDGFLPIPDRVLKTIFMTFPVFLYALHRRPVHVRQGQRIPRP